MPELDGYELARTIRVEPKIAMIELVMLTSAGVPDDASNCQNLKIAVCLIKPVRQSELFNALMKVMSAQIKEIARERQEDLTAVTTQQLPIIPARHVLLVDDHPVNQKVASCMLERMHHTVSVASNGSEALSMLEGQTVDLVLMDLQMPIMDGFAAIAAIRQREALSGGHLPVLALTAHAMRGDRERCLDAGFDGYLSKPVRQLELQEAINALAGVRTQPAPHPPSQPASGLIAGLLKICDGDEAFARELAESFLTSAPICIAGISDAVRAADPLRLATEAHGLKGISRTIGADELAHHSGQLEDLARNQDLALAGSILRHLVSEWNLVRVGLEQLTNCGVNS
jgi:two-component system, sensor histidine kinase and response regulator